METIIGKKSPYLFLELYKMERARYQQLSIELSSKSTSLQSLKRKLDVKPKDDSNDVVAVGGGDVNTSESFSLSNVVENDEKAPSPKRIKLS
jgi:hypothetical protein